GELAAGAAPQAPALAVAAPGQPSPRAGATKTQRAAGQQAGFGTGLGAQGNLLPFLGLPIGDLGGEPAAGAATQAPALAVAAPGQPSPLAGATKTQRAAGQQAGHGTGLGAQGNLLPFLGLQIPDLGGSLS